MVPRPRSGDDLIIAIGGTSDQLTIQSQFDGFDYWQIENFHFADGTVWTALQIRQMLLAQEVAATSGSVLGYANSNDTLIAGLGDKYLNGEGGADTYVYSSAGGNDTIDDGLNSRSNLVFSDINASDVSLSRTGSSDDLMITDTATGKTVTVKGQFNQFGYGTMQTITFADGTVWTPADVRTRLIAQEESASNATVYGFTRSDTLDGAAGNETLVGNGGGDTYIFGRGYQHEVINAYIGDVRLDQPDTVVFKAGIAPSDLQLSRSGEDLNIAIAGTSDQLRIVNQFDHFDYWQIENFQFADGTVWTSQQVRQMLLAQETAATSGSSGLCQQRYAGGGIGRQVPQRRGWADHLRIAFLRRWQRHHR